MRCKNPTYNVSRRSFWARSSRTSRLKQHEILSLDQHLVEMQDVAPTAMISSFRNAGIQSDFLIRHTQVRSCMSVGEYMFRHDELNDRLSITYILGDVLMRRIVFALGVV